MCWRKEGGDKNVGDSIVVGGCMFWRGREVEEGLTIFDSRFINKKVGWVGFGYWAWGSVGWIRLWVNYWVDLFINYTKGPFGLSKITRTNLVIPEN